MNLEHGYRPYQTVNGTMTPVCECGWVGESSYFWSQARESWQRHVMDVVKSQLKEEQR